MNNIFAQIQKYEKLDDDIIIVTGIASSETLDNQNEVVKSSAIKDALPDYMAIGGTGALREMHQSKAAGTVFKAEVLEDGNTLIEARVVDKDACKKIEQGVYKGFSIGGKIVKKEGNAITKLKLTEISLVDRPCNPDSLFSMYKADDVKIESSEKSINKKLSDAFNKMAIEKLGKSAYDYTQEVGLGNISRLTYILSELQCLQSCSEYEREMEGDNSPLPEDLTNAITSLYDILVRMAQEEFQEFTDINDKEDIKMSDNTKDLSKASMETPKVIFDEITSKVSAIQQDQIKPTDIESLFSSLKTRLVDAGYITDQKIINPDNNVGWSNKSDSQNDLNKITVKFDEEYDQKLNDFTENFKKEIEKYSESINKRLDALESSPVPDKVVLKNVSGDVISKSEDVKGEIEIHKVDREKFSNLKLEDKELAALDVIKTIHAKQI